MSKYIENVLVIIVFIAYVSLITSWIMFGCFICIEKEKPKLGATIITAGVIFFILTLAALRQ